MNTVSPTFCDLNCPVCDEPITPVRTDDDTHLYHCFRHGLLVLSPDGRTRQLP